MDLRHRLGGMPERQSSDPALGSSRLQPQPQKVSRIREAFTRRPPLAKARQAKREGQATAKANPRTPSGHFTATWIAPSIYRLDLRYDLVVEYEDGTIEVKSWPPISIKAAWAGQQARATGTSPVGFSIEVAANQPIEVRLTLMSLDGIIASLMGQQWGEVITVDSGGQVTAGPLPGHQPPQR